MGRKQEESHVKSSAEQEQHLTCASALNTCTVRICALTNVQLHIHSCAVGEKMHISLFLYSLQKLQIY